MSAKVCKKCGRSRPVNQETCGCSGKVKFRTETTPITEPITHVTTKPPIVAEGATSVIGQEEMVTSVIGPGEECPTCHRRMPSKAAMRQAAWRASKEGT